MDDNFERTLEAAMARFRREQTPLGGNRCRGSGCNGTLVQRVTSLRHEGGFNFDTPECEVCKRRYRYADRGSVPKVGQEEFLEVLRTPFTV